MVKTCLILRLELSAYYLRFRDLVVRLRRLEAGASARHLDDNVRECYVSLRNYPVRYTQVVSRGMYGVIWRKEEGRKVIRCSIGVAREW
jgi:hypothetical protein